MMEVDIIFWPEIESRVDYRKKTWKAQLILEPSRDSHRSPNKFNPTKDLRPSKLAIFWFDFIDFDGAVC